MKKILFLMLSFTLFCVAAEAQTNEAEPTTSATSAESSAPTKKPRRKAFRPTKDQIIEAQTYLRAQDHYSGEATGKYNPETRAAIKIYQEANGLKKTGRLDRVTLEAMGIALTDSQKEMPVTVSSKTAESKDGTAKAKRKIFRASRDQVSAAQRTLKAGGLYDGEETGRLNDATRAGLKKYQEANGLKVTGTLSRVTLEKMEIELTDKQKADAAAENN